MRTTMIAGLLLVMALLAGCGEGDMMKALAPSADQQTATHYIDLLRQHQFDQIEKNIDPSIRSTNLHETLVHMSADLPADEPISVKVIGFNVFNASGVIKKNVTFEYQYPHRWLLANVAIMDTDGRSTIVGFNIKPMSESLESANRFTLSGKGAAQYGVMILALLAFLISLYALVLCARTPMAGRKWLWIIFILFGFGRLSVNWTTGQLGFLPLSFQLFSASAFSQFYGPWIVAVSFPLGAIWFFLRRKHLIARTVPPALPRAHA
jgi:hypothetical protein